MLQLINQFSYLVTSVFLLVVTGGLLAWRRKGFHLREAGLLAVMAILLLLGWFASRPAKVTAVTAGQIRAQLGQGKPVLVEFQSPY